VKKKLPRRFEIAIRHPEVVRKMVVMSGFFKREGANPEFWEQFNHVKLESMPGELREAYLKTTPHPEQLQSFFDKSVERMRDFKDIPAGQIRSIGAPTLVMIGDSDVVRPEHAVETFRLLPHAQLAVLPETDHMMMVKRTEWEVSMVEAFLDALD
jgi:pimeloyl-ACP methyl ester carboxylesterase